MKQPFVSILLPRRETYSAHGAGGVALAIQALASESRFKENMCVFGHNTQQPLNGCSFTSVALAPIWHGKTTRRYLQSMVKLLRDRDGVIEIHNRPEYVHFIRSKLPKALILLYLHNDPRSMKAARTPLERARLLTLADSVVCVSSYIRDCFCESVADTQSRVVVVKNAVLSSLVADDAVLGTKRKEIIFMGRLIPDKGAHLLAEAALDILPNHPDWKVIFVGSRFFGNNKKASYEDKLISSLSALGDQVEITGYLPREASIQRLRNASIAVLPSLWEEPVGLVPIEAMASGCAVVTTRRGGIPERLEDAAVYLDAETPQSVAKALENLIAQPDDLLKFQRSALTHARQNMTAASSATTLDELRLRLWKKRQAAST